MTWLNKHNLEQSELIEVMNRHLSGKARQLLAATAPDSDGDQVVEGNKFRDFLAHPMPKNTKTLSQLH